MAAAPANAKGRSADFDHGGRARDCHAGHYDYGASGLEGHSVGIHQWVKPPPLLSSSGSQQRIAKTNLPGAHPRNATWLSCEPPSPPLGRIHTAEADCL